MHVLLKAPTKTQWSSRIALKSDHGAVLLSLYAVLGLGDLKGLNPALKHRHLESDQDAVLLSLYAILGPGDLKDLNPAPAHPPRSRAIATDVVAGTVEVVAGNEVASVGFSVDLAEAVSETIIEIQGYTACGFWDSLVSGLGISDLWVLFSLVIQAVSVRSITYPFFSFPIFLLCGAFYPAGPRGLFPGVHWCTYPCASYFSIIDLNPTDNMNLKFHVII